MSAAVVEPIDAQSLPAVAQFLHDHLASGRSPTEWQAALQTHWNGARPNHGFMLRQDGQVVGTICALYAEREIGGRTRKVCNITSWCVLDSHRRLSMKLAMAVVQQPGYDFTDFSPTAVVGGVLRFLKFKSLPSDQIVVFSVPGLPGGGRLLTRAGDIEATLTGAALSAYRDHTRFPWLRHVVVGTAQAWCHVIYKVVHFKGLPAAQVLHVGDPGVFRLHLGRWTAHMLSRGIATSHIESRWLRDRPWNGVVRSGFNAKVYLSDSLSDAEIDYLYSETMALDL